MKTVPSQQPTLGMSPQPDVGMHWPAWHLVPAGQKTDGSHPAPLSAQTETPLPSHLVVPGFPVVIDSLSQFVHGADSRQPCKV